MLQGIEAGCAGRAGRRAAAGGGIAAPAGYARAMSLMTFTPLAVLSIIAGVLLLVVGALLLVRGSRRRDDSSSRPLLAFGVTALVLGTSLTVPALLWLVMGLVVTT